MSSPQGGTDLSEGSGVLKEISYGVLGESVLLYGLGMAEPPEESGQSMMYAGSELLNRNYQFSSPDDIAQMVLDGKISLLPNSETFKKYRIIPVQLETGEVCLLYSPDNGKGALDSPADYHWNFTADFQSVHSKIPLENTRLIVCTHSDFESISELIGNPTKAGKYLSIFDNLEDGKVNELIESILAMGRRLGASDIHIEPGIQNSQIMMRRHGMLQLIPSKFRRVSHAVGNKIAAVLILQGGKNLSAGTPEDAAYRYVKQGTIAKDDEGRGKFVETSNPHLHDTDYRISVIPTVGDRFSSVVRLLMGHEGIKSLADLGYDNVDELIDAGKIAYGMVIVCGPTGSGKTTTLAALQNETRDPSKKNITVEDPVEIMLPHHVQSQANAAKGYGMGEALRRILRHDPDRIMVTEIRDEETAKLAIAAGNTGHAVLTTLHANTAAESVKRLQRLGVDALDIATVVQYVFAQRLVESLSPTDEFVEWYDATNVDGKNELSDLLGFDVQGPVYLRRNIKPEGIIGRIPIYEKIAITPALVDLIESAEDKISSPAIEAAALKEGFIPMEIYALKQILRGRTTVTGVLRYVNKRRMRQFQDLAATVIQEYARTTW